MAGARREIDRRPAQVTLKQAVKEAGDGGWGVPEFQRDFVWSPKRVAALADTLLGGFSMGAWHLWRPGRASEVRSRSAIVEYEPEQWVLDGQQRLTAACVLRGAKPLWFTDGEWDDLVDTIPVALDLRALRRGTAKVVLRAVGAPDSAAFLPFPMLFADAGTLQEALAERGEAKLYAAARDLNGRVNEYIVPTITLHHSEQHEVVRQFEKLNKDQTTVSPSEIRQGLVSVQVPGFTVDLAEPLRVELAAAGWPVRRRSIFDGFVQASGAKTVAALDRVTVDKMWPDYAAAWDHVIDYLAKRGIVELSLWPAERLVTTLVVTACRWPQALRDDRLWRWAVCAQWDGHQQRDGALQRDMGLLNGAWRAKATWPAAIELLAGHLAPTGQPVRVGDLTDMRTNPAGGQRVRERMLYAITYPSPPVIGKRGDWSTWLPLGERDSGGLADFVLVRTPDGVPVPASGLTAGQLKAQAAERTHSTRRRADTLAAALNHTLDQLATIRPNH